MGMSLNFARVTLNAKRTACLIVGNDSFQLVSRRSMIQLECPLRVDFGQSHWKRCYSFGADVCQSQGL
jgi:hypothetical protein